MIAPLDGAKSTDWSETSNHGDRRLLQFRPNTPPAIGRAFDAAYLRDMEVIHGKDGAAFASEAKSGSNPKLKAVAAETFRIVQRHIGELRAVGP